MARLISCFLIFAFLTPVSSGQEILFARAGAGGFDLWTVPETGGAPSLALTGATFLPIELAGVPRHQRLRQDRPVLDLTSSPAAHVRLPNGGALYRIRRAGETSILQVRADGSPALLLTLPDANGEASILSRIAVAADGLSALVASSFAAGGDAYRLDLAAAGAANLTSTKPPLMLSDISLRLGSERAWFVADALLWRTDLSAGDQARALDPASAPGVTLLPELVMSDDGLTLAYVLDQGPGLRRIGIANAQGQLRIATPIASDYDLPGYDLPTGPLLALSPDGLLLAFRRTVLAKELFVCRTDLPSVVDQLTADGNFADTIDNVGVIGFIGARQLIFAAGELGPGALGGPIDSADVFVADFTAAASQLLNVTQTSGIISAPFLDPGELEILEVYEDPAGERLIVIADTSGSGDSLVGVMPLDGSAGLEVVIEPMDGFPTLSALGSHVLVVHPTVEPGVPNDFNDVRLLSPAGDPHTMTLFGSAPGSIGFGRTSASPAHDRAAFIVTAGPNLDLLIMVDLATDTPLVLWPDFLGHAPATGFSPSGRLLTGLGFTGGPFLFAAFDGPFSGEVLPVPHGDGFPLNR